jgi:hypothetical protein
VQTIRIARGNLNLRNLDMIVPHPIKNLTAFICLDGASRISA